MSAEFHDFRIIQKDGTPYKCVMLDGQELQGVVSVDVEMEVDTLTKVTLEILTNHCEMLLKEPIDFGITNPVIIYGNNKQVYPAPKEENDYGECD